MVPAFQMLEFIGLPQLTLQLIEHLKVGRKNKKFGDVTMGYGKLCWTFSLFYEALNE